MTPLSEALDKVVAFLQSYMVFQHDEQADAVALWIAVTHAYEAFDIAPYLLVTSPERGSGKTVLLDCAEVLVREPLMAASVTAAVVARVTHERHPTLLIDEVDAVYRDKTESGEALRGVLNAGHRRGSPYLRMGGPKNSQLQEFDTFGPKGLAGIDKSGRQIPDTIRDRSVLIRLQRANPTVVRQRFRHRNARVEAKPIREAIAAGVAGFVFQYDTDIPDELAGRAADVWEPLLAIADLAGEDWPKRAREAAVLLGTPDADTDSLGIRLLSDLRQVWDGQAPTMFSVDLITRLRNMDEAPWDTLGENREGIDARALAGLLKPYGITSGTVRTGDQTAKGYARDRMVQAWESYLGIRHEEGTQLNLPDPM